jgi:phenylacetate-CoA ligase
MRLHAAMPTGPTEPAAELIASKLRQLDRSQWWSADRMRKRQFGALGDLFLHCWDTIPFYRRRLEAAGWQPGWTVTQEVLARVPVLTREEFQAHTRDVRSPQVPWEHGRATESQTSGSTGQPLKFQKTDLTHLMWSALTVRHHQWHQRDLSAKMLAIRTTHGPVQTRPTILEDWGPPESGLFKTGPCVILDCRQNASHLLDCVIDQAPQYLLCLPSTLDVMARLSLERGLHVPTLRGVDTYAETLTPQTRELIRQAWGVPIQDMYSCQELGYIALQCPDHEHYHVQSDSILVEVLDDEDRPCEPGQIGRVVATSLLNYASPLIRYEVRDYAEPGETCDCGRGLAVIRRIVGRRRNLIALPDGARIWPVLASKAWSSVAPIKQIQLVQKTPHRFEARVVMDRALTGEEQTNLTEALQISLGYPFEFDYKLHSQWLHSATGKFETVISEVN